MKQPYVIGFCGIDGSGKTSQLEFATNYLTSLGYKVKQIKVELIATQVLFKLSEKLFGDPYGYHPGIPPSVMNIAVACDVANHYLKAYENLEDYDFVLCDRHKLCYITYAKAYGADMEWVEKILSLVPDPDLVLYFDIDANIADERLVGRTEKPKKTDEDKAFLMQVRNQYINEIKSLQNVLKIEGNQTRETIQEIIREKLKLIKA